MSDPAQEGRRLFQSSADQHGGIRTGGGIPEAPELVAVRLEVGVGSRVGSDPHSPAGAASSLTGTDPGLSSVSGPGSWWQTMSSRRMPDEPLPIRRCEGRFSTRPRIKARNDLFDTGFLDRTCRTKRSRRELGPTRPWSNRLLLRRFPRSGTQHDIGVSEDHLRSHRRRMH